MKINTLTLKNFRNYQKEVVKFEDGLNILVGKNAQGKTNIIEAIFFIYSSYFLKLLYNIMFFIPRKNSNSYLSFY